MSMPGELSSKPDGTWPAAEPAWTTLTMAAGLGERLRRQGPRHEQRGLAQLLGTRLTLAGARAGGVHGGLRRLLRGDDPAGQRRDGRLHRLGAARAGRADHRHGGRLAGRHRVREAGRDLERGRHLVVGHGLLGLRHRHAVHGHDVRLLHRREQLLGGRTGVAAPHRQRQAVAAAAEHHPEERRERERHDQREQQREAVPPGLQQVLARECQDASHSGLRRTGAGNATRRSRRRRRRTRAARAAPRRCRRCPRRAASRSSRRAASRWA